MIEGQKKVVQRNKSSDALKMGKLRLNKMLSRMKANDENDSNTSN